MGTETLDNIQKYKSARLIIYPNVADCPGHVDSCTQPVFQREEGTSVPPIWEFEECAPQLQTEYSHQDEKGVRDTSGIKMEQTGPT